MLPRLLIVGAWEAGLMGDPTLARVRVEEGIQLAAETGADFWSIAGAAVAAALGAIYGDAGDAEERAAEAMPRAALVGARFVVAIAQQARGLAALAAGRYEDAYDHLRRILDPSDHAFHPVHRRWVLVDLAEAACHYDRVAEARALVGELEAQGGRIPGCAFDVGLSYASAVLADEAEAEERFDAALAADLASWPLQRARLLLAYGSWLRRRRRPADSRLPLREARDLFDALGVAAWGNRAREELRASGETSRERTPLARDRLTSQELQIAQLAASGLTNRQIGSQLFLSHRTVGSHLYRVYPKLGITSRVNLRTALAESASS
jgi:ATP/maltotriose-dependent transcriptional regulator MalT